METIIQTITQATIQTMMQTINEKKYGVRITLYEGKGMGPDSKLLYYRTDLSFDTYMKYQWYFRYRTALFQVAYKDRYVRLENFSFEYIPTHVQLLKKAKDRWIGKKATLTKYKNRLRKAEEKWNGLFPIHEDIRYLNTLAKINSYENEVLKSFIEYEELLKQQD